MSQETQATIGPSKTRLLLDEMMYPEEKRWAKSWEFELFEDKVRTMRSDLDNTIRKLSELQRDHEKEITKLHHRIMKFEKTRN
jgi:hypothetical protein